MSTGNAGAAIGLANTNKVGPLGAYVQTVGPTTVADAQAGNRDPSSSVNFMGPSGPANFDYNALGEAIGFTAPANNGAAAGKTAQWIQLGVGGLTNAQTRVNISAGVGTYNAAGTHDVFCSLYANRTLPANTYCWAFER